MSEVRTITDESLAQAVEIIRDGGLIVIPTDTVYGVACDPRNVEAIRKIYMVKQRPKYKPLQVLLASIDGLDALRLDLPVPLNRLAAMFMPGAFSPIAEARDNCSLATVRRDPATGKTTQGVRIPNSAATLRILRAVGNQRKPFRRGKRADRRRGGRGLGRCRRPVSRWRGDARACVVHGGRGRSSRTRRYLDPSRGSDTRSRDP